MKKIYALTARVVSVVSKPILGLYLHNSRRVRTLVICGEYILLQKSSFGSQKWSIPGGGIEKGENAVDAAIRETYEETSVMISEKNIRCLGEQRVPSGKYWPVIALVFYEAQIQSFQSARISRPLEILEVKWFKLTELPDEKSKTVDIALKLSSL